MWLYSLQQGLQCVQGLQEGLPQGLQQGLNVQHGLSFIGKDAPLEKIIANLIEIGLFSSVLYVYVFILDSVIPSQLKYSICYLFFFRQPGYSIFTKIRNSSNPDSRFTKEDALKLYADVYNRIDNAVSVGTGTANDISNGISSSNVAGNCVNTCEDKGKIENSSWYRIYSKYRNDGMISSSNRDYLLCRDLCIMTILLLIFYVLYCFILSETPNRSVIIFLAIEIVVTDAAFWIRGNRLAYNVLSLDISEKLRKSSSTSNNAGINVANNGVNREADIMSSGSDVTNGGNA